MWTDGTGCDTRAARRRGCVRKGEIAAGLASVGHFFLMRRWWVVGGGDDTVVSVCDESAPVAGEGCDGGFSLSLGDEGGRDLLLKRSSRLPNHSHAPRRAVQGERRQSIHVVASRILHVVSSFDARPRPSPVTRGRRRGEALWNECEDGVVAVAVVAF